MVKVIELGYIGFNVTDFKTWKKFATEYVGLEYVKGKKNDRFHLRMDNQHHRITIHKSKEDDMAYMGWRVATLEDFQAMPEQLSNAGIDFKIASEKEAEERHVLGLIKLTDPSGTPNEIYFSPQVDVMKPFHPHRGMYGKFVTGDQGLGHVLIRSDDDQATYDFYAVLGLTGAIEYKLPLPNGAVAKPTFMTCNPRQHIIAFGLPGMEKRINHLMLQYTDFDDLGIAHDIIRKAGVDVAMQLGKHANDQLYTFYCNTPSNWLLELGWGPAVKPIGQEHYVGDIFGHAVETPGLGMDLEL